MSNELLGVYLRKLREERKLPLRKVAAFLDIDTSTLSKIERAERPLSIEYLEPLSEILGIDAKMLQIRFLKERITQEYGTLQYLIEGLKETIKDLK